MIKLIALLTLLSSCLAPAAQSTDGDSRIPVLIVSGANNHWWQWTAPSLQEILEESGKFEVTLTTEPAKALTGDLDRYAAVVLDYNGPRWGEAAEQSFVAAVEEGLGVVVHHAANNAFEGWREYEEMVALMWREGTGHGAFHAFDVQVVDRGHPITHDMPDMIAHPDELYHKLVHMHGTEYTVLASAYSDPESGGTGEHEPMVIVKSYGKGRIFHNALGHVWPGGETGKRSHRDPAFRDLMVRGTEWAATGEVTPCARPNVLTAAEAENGWTSLFDGESTEHWRGFRSEGFPEKGWVIDGDALHVQAGGGGGDIITRESYRDFELAFEWKVSPGANSGVMYHVSTEGDASWQTGPEYQIEDDQATGRADTLTGAASCYALFKAQPKSPREPGVWNSGRILIVGNHLEHWLNGVRVVNTEMHGPLWNERLAASKFASMPGFGVQGQGHLCLQDHGNDVWFRNLKIRKLDADPAAEVALFNGKDLAGWTHHLTDDSPMEAVWSVSDEGVLECKGNPIGYLRTEAEHTNFTLRLDWRFDPVTKQAGNSGVLLRRIGEDKVWPRSIEAQLQSGAAGDYWNIDEFPMQVVAERTRGRNTKRTATNENPIGEWNRYEITLWHGHCVLRVNGQILNQAWDCREVAGHICLQSEGAPIHFRDIQLMPLP